MSLFGWSSRNASVLWLGAGALCVTGVWAAGQLPSGIYPEMDFPRIVVVARSGDAAADLTAATVTRPLEAALSSVPGVVQLRSRTIRGTSEVSVTFASGTDMARALAQVDGRANEARGDLPPGTVLQAERITPSAFPVVTFNLAGPVPATDLLELAEQVVRPAFSQVDGVGAVGVLGGQVREVEVLVDPDRAAAVGLDVPGVAAAIAAADVRQTAGQLFGQRQAMTIETTSQAADLDALAALPLAVTDGMPLPVSAVADVVEGAADATASVAGPDGETVLLSVARREGASTPVVVAGAHAAAAALADRLPPGVTLKPVYDQAVLVNDAITSVRDAIVLGMVLAVGLLGVMLRDLRAGLLAGLAVPLTLMLTFGAMWATGQTLNLMSLGGMAIAIGLVVDDAIVIVEAISLHREAGMGPAEAAEAGVSELFAAVVGTTLTTVVVFLPLGLLSGVVGHFFAALGATLAMAVLLSMVVALLLVPLAASRLGREGPAHTDTPDGLSARYARLLQASLRHRWVGFVGAMLLLVAGGAALSRVETGFLPVMDEGAFVLDYFLPSGTTLAGTSAVADRISAVLDSEPDVERWARRAGAELGPAAATEVSRGDIMVRLTPRAVRSRSADEVMDSVRARLEEDVPEARTELFQVLADVLGDLAGAPHALEIKLYGPEPERVRALAEQIAPQIEPIEGIEDFFGGVDGAAPVLRFRVDPVATGQLGRTVGSVADLLEQTVRGAVVAVMPWRDRQIDVRVRAPDAVRTDPAALAALPLLTGRPDAPVTTLAAVARPVVEDGPASVLREDQRPVVVITGAIEGGDLGAVMGQVSDALDGVTPPAGYSVELAGAWRQQQGAFGEIARVLALAVLAVGVVLVGQLRSLRLALLVLSTTPVAVVGALLSLWATGVPLNVSSLMGVVLLVGLVVKNGILLLEQAVVLEERGVPRVDALVQAGARRLRPILLTTLCTMAGLLPLALGIGAGSELQQPLAVAVLGGLAVSTVVSLFLLPALAAGRAREGRS